MSKNIKKAIVVKKLGMTSFFDEENNVQQVTVLQGIDLKYLNAKNEENDGYSAALVAYKSVPKTKLNKAEQGVFDALKSDYFKSIKELRMDKDYLNELLEAEAENVKNASAKKSVKKQETSDTETAESTEEAKAEEAPSDQPAKTGISDVLKVSAFEGESKVFLQGNSKGKGFTGTIKAHNFRRGPETHGSKNTRLPGSIGAGTDPARVFKGQRMGKKFGNALVTQVNFIVSVDSEKQLIYVRGSVPGARNSELLLYC